MNKLLTFLMLISLLAACSHHHKKTHHKECCSKKESSLIGETIIFEEGDKTFSSRLQLPAKEGKLPLVVIIHEWWGRNNYIMDRSAKLNDAGYATLAVDLYGNAVTVETPKEAQDLATPFYQDPGLGVSRLNKYLELAKKHPQVDSSRIYVIGFCFGGTQALNLARSGAEVKGVVSFHGGLASSLTAEALKPRILVLHGGADPMVPPKEVKAFKDEMNKAKARYQLITYPGATHAFTNPKATEVGKTYNIPIAYNKKADEASWRELMKFLKQ